MIKQDYIKDKSSGAILNINIKEFEELKQRRKQDKQLREYEKRITQLEARVVELSNSLRAVLEKLSVVSSQ